ncbi:MAG: MoxR family ATPase [Firmicutes bacterium]|uniref:MoxR-like ATPase n=1 Tax=Melghirimyces thermohalophilus TaxID=1236220 RepID=A0A1G6J7M7_9BACL|nr:MoxR family ATPase [Melghirimyces thermohalophilus]MDA8352339.1 MoxR family ATPase [Bacillota bacterium]SDC14687.1 MoxR-like ATPase [Melghirimyces thermohalophilus]
MDSKQIGEITDKVLKGLAPVVVGQKEQLRLLWASFLTGGHVLLEGVPGLGKTLMARALGAALDMSFARIQFTPDLMPADVTGTNIFDIQSGQFTFKRGPIFHHLILADEINRTPPKTQAALLEAMEEGHITVDGGEFSLPQPFFVVATQNPIEYEGTYPLPEAQLDRFMVKLTVDYPKEAEEMAILKGHRLTARREEPLDALVSAEEVLSCRKALDGVRADDVVVRYITALVRATRDHPQVILGASPRAGISLLVLGRALAAMDGRDYVTPDDIKRVVAPVFRHRLVPSPDVELEGLKIDDLVEEITRSVSVPR